MVSEKLLNLLVCPATKTRLQPADDELLRRLNAAIESGGVTKHSGEPVKGTLGAGLVREDGAVLYPVVDEIPILLIDESIALDQLPAEGE